MVLLSVLSLEMQSTGHFRGTTAHPQNRVPAQTAPEEAQGPIQKMDAITHKHATGTAKGVL